MRLPVTAGDDSAIDEAATAEMVAYAMEKGINYFDTARGYHGGHSEEVMGRVLGKYPRESYYLATKFPGYDLSNMDKVEEIFEKQLKKCGVEYFDFYLFHNVCEMNIDAYLDEKYRIYQYLLKQKEAGRICHLGFSAHGSYEVMKLLELYNEHCFTGGGFLAPMALMAVPEDKHFCRKIKRIIPENKNEACAESRRPSVASIIDLLRLLSGMD